LGLQGLDDPGDGTNSPATNQLQYHGKCPENNMSMSQEFNNPDENYRHEGRYANYFKVGHNAFEFVFDFGQVHPEEEKAQLHTRIIASPNCAKALLETLQESLHWFEGSFGPVQNNDTHPKAETKHH
jgi:hypothetical protein